MRWRTQYIMDAQTSKDVQAEQHSEGQFTVEKDVPEIQQVVVEQQAPSIALNEVSIASPEIPVLIECSSSNKPDIESPLIQRQNTQSIAELLESKPEEQQQFEMMTSIKSSEDIIPLEEEKEEKEQEKTEPITEKKQDVSERELNAKSDSEQDNAFKAVNPILAQQLLPQSLQQNIFSLAKEENQAPTILIPSAMLQINPISFANIQSENPSEKNQTSLPYYGSQAKIEVIQPQKLINSAISEPAPTSISSIPPITAITPSSQIHSGSTTYIPARKEIRPPSPKGERKPKPWQRLGVKKVVASATEPKPQETVKKQPMKEQSVKIQPIATPSLATTISSDSILPKIQEQATLPVTISNETILNPSNTTNKKFKLETKIYEIAIQSSKPQSIQQTLRTAPSPLSPLTFKFYQNQYQKYRLPQSGTQANVGEQKSVEQTQLNPAQSSKPPILSFTEQPNKQFDNKTSHHNPLFEYQRYAPRQESQLPLPEQSQQVQPPAVEPFPQDEPNNSIRPLSSVSSDEDNVIIRDASFERDGVEKAKEKSKQIEQLELQIRKQQQLSRQLERQTSFVIKLAISGAIGLVTAGISWTARKSRVAAAIMGAAAGVGTFLLHK